MAENTMAIDTIVNQLGSLREHCSEFARAEKDTVSIWRADVDACGAAINILFSLTEEGVKDVGAALDLVHDYRALAKQYKALHLQHEAAGKPVYKDGVWHCPACNRRVDPRHSFCHRCGKRLDCTAPAGRKRK